MQKVKTAKVDAVAEFAASTYASAESDALAAERGTTREALALSLVHGPEKRGVLPPALRARLDRMTGDYAVILKRIDDLRRMVDGDAEPNPAPARVC